MVDFSKKIVNTDKFRDPAISFQTHGRYTTAPRGTTAYYDYWDEQYRRCVLGYTSLDNDYITGYHYFYLNFCPILLNKIKQVTLRSGEVVEKSDRVREFANFWDYDYYFFHAIEEAENKGSHLVTTKARGKGYSFKAASMLTRNFFLFPKSRNYAIAEESEFLIKDGVLTKAWENIDFINTYTAWSKKMQKKNTDMHKRASYVAKDPETGVEIEKGSLSEIIGISLKNDANRARGKRAKLIIWEEAGKFRNLLQAWQIAQPSVEESGIAFGFMLAFGTGGTAMAEYHGLDELFNSPDAYNALGFENVWEAGASKKCGFFVPEYANMSGKNDEGVPYMDKDGNSNIDAAIEATLSERRKIEESANDRDAVDRYVAEHPNTPSEAMLKLTGNIFPKKDLVEHITQLTTNEKLLHYGQVGRLILTENGQTEWKSDGTDRVINRYPLERSDSKEGAIIIWEHPKENAGYGLYIAGIDPYDHDDAGTSASLGSCIIYKRIQDFEQYYDVPVAEYTGRPDTAEEYYENVRRLLVYFNARALYENEKKGLFSYFTQKHCDYLLADQPDIIKDVVQNSTVNRHKGIHMVKSIKDWGERLIRDWLTSEYAPGKKNLTKIMSIPLLQELLAYHPEANTDRVMAFMMVMIYKEELHNMHVKESRAQERKDSFFSKPLFSDIVPRIIT